jgi:hypothetical protein
MLKCLIFIHGSVLWLALVVRVLGVVDIYGDTPFIMFLNMYAAAKMKCVFLFFDRLKVLCSWYSHVTCMKQN